MPLEYELNVVQQPGSVASCSFYGDKLSRKVVSPCPIFQLVRRDENGTIQRDIQHLGDISWYIAHVFLYSNNDEDVSIINTKSLETDPNFQVYSQQIQARKKDEHDASFEYERVLEGNPVSSCHILTDLYGNKGAYFVFEDLSVKIEGLFKLKALVSDLSKAKIDNSASYLCSAFTDSFRCYPPGTILDRKESSQLSKHFADQGVKIPIKHKTKSRSYI